MLALVLPLIVWDHGPPHPVMVQSFRVPATEAVTTSGASAVPVDYRDNINWPVKDQLLCGDCYVYASAAAVESRHFVETGQYVVVSETFHTACASWVKQNHVNHQYGDACAGGWPPHLLAYLHATGYACGCENSAYIAAHANTLGTCWYGDAPPWIPWYPGMGSGGITHISSEPVANCGSNSACNISSSQLDTCDTCTNQIPVLGVNVGGGVLQNAADEMSQALQKPGGSAIAVVIDATHGRVMDQHGNVPGSYPTGLESLRFFEPPSPGQDPLLYGNCGSASEVDHAVAIVGEDVTSYGTPYWIVRNSWGSGPVGYDEGHFYVKKGINSCGIESAPVQVTGPPLPTAAPTVAPPAAPTPAQPPSPHLFRTRIGCTRAA